MGNPFEWLRGLRQKSKPEAETARSPQRRILPALVSGATFLVGCFTQPRLVANSESVHLLLGNPSEATTDPANANNYLIVRPQYVMSYNRDRGSANWVSWQLNRNWVGRGRRLDFMPDESLPEGWYQVTPQDYTGSGFDRGHIVPAADRNRRSEDSRSVFLMSNIMPQSPGNNQGPWNELEMYCRDLVAQGKELYIMAGGTGVGGVGSRGRRDIIGRGRVVVPEYTWKIILVLDRPITSAEEVQVSDRVIAVIMPNIDGIRRNDWRQYRQSVDQIEQLTGYDFLSALPEDVESILEARIDGLED